MRPFRFLVLLLAVLPCVFGSGVAAAQAPAAHPLILAFSPLPPWKGVDSAGRPFGPYYDIMTRLARKAGLPLSTQVCPLLRCLDLLRRGDADIGIGIAPGPDRSAYLDFLVPAFAGPTRMCFYRRRGDEASRVNAYDDLKRLRIGVTSGAHYYARFDQDSTLNKDVAPDKLSNLRKLVNLRVDVVIMVCGEGALLTSRDEFRRRVELAGPEVRTGPRYLVLSRQSALYAHKADLQRALRQMVASGEIRRLLAPIEH